MDLPEPPAAWTWACIAAGVLALGWIAWRWRSEAGAPPRGSAAPQPWGLLWVAVALMLYLGTAVAVVVILLATGRMSLAEADRVPLRTQLALDGVAKVVALGAVIFGHAALARRGSVPKGSPAPPGAAAVAGAIAGVAILPVMLGIQWVQRQAYEAGGLEFETQALVRQVFGEDDFTLALFAFFAVVAAPIFEEIVFRGFLLGGLRRWMGPWGAALLSAAAFSAYHLEVDVMPALLALGLALAWLRERTGGLVAPIAMHACYNAVQVAGIAMARGG